MNTSDPKSKAAEESAAEDSHEDSKVEERTGVAPQGYIPPSLVVSASRDMQENLQKEFTAELFATEEDTRTPQGEPKMALGALSWIAARKRQSFLALQQPLVFVNKQSLKAVTVQSAEQARLARVTLARFADGFVVNGTSSPMGFMLLHTPSERVFGSLMSSVSFSENEVMKLLEANPEKAPEDALGPEAVKIANEVATLRKLKSASLASSEVITKIKDFLIVKRAVVLHNAADKELLNAIRLMLQDAPRRRLIDDSMGHVSPDQSAETLLGMTCGLARVMSALDTLNGQFDFDTDERRRRAVNTFQLNWGQLGPNYKVAMEVERFEAVYEAWHESFEVVSGLPGCEGMPTVSKFWALLSGICNPSNSYLATSNYKKVAGVVQRFVSAAWQQPRDASGEIIPEAQRYAMLKTALFALDNKFTWQPAASSILNVDSGNGKGGGQKKKGGTSSGGGGAGQGGGGRSTGGKRSSGNGSSGENKVAGGGFNGFSANNCTLQIHCGKCNRPQCPKYHLSAAEHDKLPLCRTDPNCPMGLECGFRHASDIRAGSAQTSSKAGGALNFAAGVSLQPGTQLGAVKMSSDGSTIESFEPIIEDDDE
jgi:hypothetical protein